MKNTLCGTILFKIFVKKKINATARPIAKLQCFLWLSLPCDYRVTDEALLAKPIAKLQCFLWLSLPGDYRVTDEALLAETT